MRYLNNYLKVYAEMRSGVALLKAVVPWINVLST